MTILITGTNRGIGAALAEAYRTRGDTVLGTARKAGAADITLDVTQPEDFTRLEDRLSETALSLLVCNAGIYNDKDISSLDDLSPDLWQEAFAANVTGVFLTIRACLPALRRGQGKIAIMSSIMASSQRAPGGALIYRASKAAVLNLGRNMARDLDLPVGIYHPGWVQTEMGGDEADITVDVSVAGLLERFDALSPENSGVFEGYDGTVLPY